MEDKDKRIEPHPHTCATCSPERIRPKLAELAKAAECPEGDRNGVCREKAEVCGTHYRTALLRIEELKKRIESGSAAHRDDRAARDWLARENDRLKAEVERLQTVIRAALAELHQLRQRGA